MSLNDEKSPWPVSLYDRPRTFWNDKTAIISVGRLLGVISARKRKDKKMRKKILKVFFVILTGITVTLTGCELSGSNESAQTESESGKDAVKFIPNLTTAVTRKPTPTAVAANPGDSVQNQQSGNNAEAEIYQSQGDPADQESAQEETYQSQGDPADQESAQEETYDIQYITGNILYSDENTITVEVGESGNYYNMVFNIENAVLNIANGSAVRSGLNVDLEYYSQNNVNIVIMLTSDGEEYLPSSTLEEAQKMADEYVPDVSESENEDFEDTSPSEY